MKILTIKNLSKSFGKTPVLQDISFEVGSGEIVAILGESGCGKSTLLSAIAGFFGIDGGEIWLCGEKVADSANFAPPKERNVGILFQDYALFPHFSVKENILFGIAHLQKAEQKQRYDELVAMLGLETLGTRYPHEISGGQQQRVALARSLAPRPKMILFDEPFSNLNHTMSTRMRSDIKAILRTHGLSAIFVTHDREDAFALADKIILMEGGKIIDKGTPKELYENPKSAQSAEFLGVINVIEKSAIENVKNANFRKFLEAKNGLIRPKELRIVGDSANGGDSACYPPSLAEFESKNPPSLAEGDSQSLPLPCGGGLRGWVDLQDSAKSAKFAESSAISNCVFAEVLDSVFYGDYYEIIVCVENLRFTLQTFFKINSKEIMLNFD
ncbi:ABC transporter ATP-binding protein [Helicobacter sp. 23-1044]